MDAGEPESATVARPFRIRNPPRNRAGLAGRIKAPSATGHVASLDRGPWSTATLPSPVLGPMGSPFGDTL